MTASPRPMESQRAENAPLGLHEARQRVIGMLGGMSWESSAE